MPRKKARLLTSPPTIFIRYRKTCLKSSRLNRLYTFLSDPSPYKITTHLSGYYAQCRPGYTTYSLSAPPKRSPLTPQDTVLNVVQAIHKTPDVVASGFPELLNVQHRAG